MHQVRRRAIRPHPDHVAWVKRHVRRHRRDVMRDAEDHIIGFEPQVFAAVDAHDSVHGIQIDVGLDPGAHRLKCIGILAAPECAVAALPGTLANIIADGVAEHTGHRVGLGQVLHLLTDDHNKLALVIHLRWRMPRNHDRLPIRDQRIVRSVPDAKVLVMNLELCSLHFQETGELEQVLSFLVFADGCAASLVSAEERGLAIDSFLAVNIPQTSHLITWRIGELGFDMHLSGQVPGEIGRSLKEMGSQVTRGRELESVDLWAVHPGGRSILDAVEKGLELPADALACSRSVLAEYGNMSSATVMFVHEKIMRESQSGQNGCAMSFGPGLTAETMLFHAA